MKLFNSSFSICLVMSLLAIGCSKSDNATPATGPTISLKTGAGYTSANTTIGKGVTFKVGIVCDKTTEDLSAYIVDYSIDGGPVTNSGNGPVTASGTSHFETDFILLTRNVTETEKWLFRISDTKGNISTKEITLTVQ